MNKFKSTTLGVCLVLCSAHSVAMLKPLQNISLTSCKAMGLASGGASAIGISYLLYKKKHLRNKIVRIIKKNPKKIIVCTSLISALGMAYYYGFFHYAKYCLHNLLYGSENPAIADVASNLADSPGCTPNGTDDPVSLEGANNTLE